MPRYLVFTGVPSARTLSSSLCERYQWGTLKSAFPNALALPPCTLAAVGRRISMIYENVIFNDFIEEHEDPQLTEIHEGDDTQPGQTTVITWPATTQDAEDNRGRSVADVTFLRPSTSISHFRSQYMTQETHETASFDTSGASSIAHFPTFHFSLHSLTPLALLHAQAQEARARQAPRASRKVNILVAVLEIEGPDTIRVKKGPEAGKEMTLVKMILGDESGGICKLSAWRQVAEDWVGLNPITATQSTKKGDIVLLENVLVSWEPALSMSTGAVPISCSASPQLKTRLKVCYRALPSVSHDVQLRPDLRLGLSDAVVRKVASVVDWFENMAGLR